MLRLLLLTVNCFRQANKQVHGAPVNYGPRLHVGPVTCRPHLFGAKRMNASSETHKVPRLYVGKFDLHFHGFRVFILLAAVWTKNLAFDRVKGNSSTQEVDTVGLLWTIISDCRMPYLQGTTCEGCEIREAAADPSATKSNRYVHDAGEVVASAFIRVRALLPKEHDGHQANRHPSLKSALMKSYAIRQPTS